MSNLHDMAFPIAALATALGSVAISPVAEAAPAVPYSAMPSSCSGAVGYNSSAETFNCVSVPQPSPTTATFGLLTTWSSNAVVQNGTYFLALSIPWNSGTIAQVVALTNGTGTPSFTAAIEINGTTLTGCGAISVGTVETVSTCSAANTMSTSGILSLVVTNVSGTPALTGIQTYGTHSIP